MTDRELLRQKINAEKQWLSVLTDNRYSNEELGLPKQMTRRQAIDESLDQLVKFRNQLKQLDNEERKR
jgi:hypothetical protein